MIDIVIGDDDEGAVSGNAAAGNMSAPRGCLRCAYFRITMDAARACDFFEFKGREMPSAVVLKTTGMECIAFTPNKKFRER